MPKVQPRSSSPRRLVIGAARFPGQQGSAATRITVTGFGLPSLRRLKIDFLHWRGTRPGRDGDGIRAARARREKYGTGRQRVRVDDMEELIPNPERDSNVASNQVLYNLTRRNTTCFPPEAAYSDHGLLAHRTLAKHATVKTIARRWMRRPRRWRSRGSAAARGCGHPPRRRISSTCAQSGALEIECRARISTSSTRLFRRRLARRRSSPPSPSAAAFSHLSGRVVISWRSLLPLPPSPSPPPPPPPPPPSSVRACVRRATISSSLILRVRHRQR